MCYFWSFTVAKRSRLPDSRGCVAGPGQAKYLHTIIVAGEGQSKLGTAGRIYEVRKRIDSTG